MKRYQILATITTAATLGFGSPLLADDVKANGIKDKPEEKKEKDAPWVDLLSAKTKKLDKHWTTTGNSTLEDGVATLKPRKGKGGWSRWTAYLWSKDVC